MTSNTIDNMENTHLQYKICELDSKIEKHYNDCIFY